MQAVLEFPEFTLAALLGILYLAVNMRGGEWHFPLWFADPASSTINAMPSSYSELMRKWLVWSNHRGRFAFGDFASCKILLVLLSLALSIVEPLPIVLLVALPAFFIPDAAVYAQMRRRQEQIKQEIPTALDLLVLCVDAGLGLDSSMQRVSSESSTAVHALHEELSILGHEIFLGKDREQAYQELFLRTGVDELKTLGSALAQATKLGLSISKILRAQSELARKRQGQRAEEKALKMPIYMAFPLWLCIMPCLMLIVLAPSLIRFYHALHGGQ